MHNKKRLESYDPFTIHRLYQGFGFSMRCQAFLDGREEDGRLLVCAVCHLNGKYDVTWWGYGSLEDHCVKAHGLVRDLRPNEKGCASSNSNSCSTY